MIPARPFSDDPRPIGVFDSGVGGLTVLRSLMTAMPGQEFIYMGDTARVPYGTKSPETIRAYALGLARALLHKDVKMIVIACNTASVHAADAIAAFAAPVPVISMVPQAAAAAAGATRNKSVLLMATQATVRSGAYAAALRALSPDIKLSTVAAQVLVSMAEEGWVDGPVARAAVEKYIGPFFTGGGGGGNEDRPDTVILGCTHFPLLHDTVRAVAGPGVTLIDSGRTAADSIVAQFKISPGATPGATAASPPRIYVTDSTDGFAAVAARFLGPATGALDIAHIDLSDFETLNKKTA